MAEWLVQNKFDGTQVMELLESGDEQPDLSNSQTNLECFHAFAEIFLLLYKHMRLPLGPILLFISFYLQKSSVVKLSWLPVVWPDLAKFHHFGKNLQIFGKFLTVYFLLGKFMTFLG